MYNNKNTNYQYGSLYLKMGGLMLKHPSSIKKKSPGRYHNKHDPDRYQ